MTIIIQLFQKPLLSAEMHIALPVFVFSLDWVPQTLVAGKKLKSSMLFYGN